MKLASGAEKTVSVTNHANTLHGVCIVSSPVEHTQPGYDSFIAGDLHFTSGLKELRLTDTTTQLFFLVSATVAQTERYDVSITGGRDVDTSGFGVLRLANVRRACHVTFPLAAAADRVQETIPELLGGDEVDEEVDGVRAVGQTEGDLNRHTQRKQRVEVQWEQSTRKMVT